MKRNSVSYKATEVTYTLTREEVIRAVCETHNICLPERIEGYEPGAYECWKAWQNADGSLDIRLRWEVQAEPVADKPDSTSQQHGAGE